MSSAFYLLLLVSPLVVAFAAFYSTSYRGIKSLIISVVVGAAFILLALKLGRIAMFNFGHGQAAGYEAWGPPVAFFLAVLASHALSIRSASAFRRIAVALIVSTIVHMSAYWAN